MYAGLLAFTALVVFGVAGLTATVSPERPQTGAVETREFHPPANAADFDAAMAAYDALQLPLADRPGRGAVKRDAGNHVAFTVYSPNGPRVITILEAEGQVRVELRRNSVWHFLENAHAALPREASRDLRIKLWSWYTEFGIWTLILMSVSGVWLWLASRPGYLWAQVSFAAGSGAFLLLYAITR
jgi:uncharacterized iron-regulated membrane protein